MVHIIVFLVKLMIVGAKANIVVAGWDGFFDQVISLLKQIKSAENDIEE